MALYSPILVFMLHPFSSRFWQAFQKYHLPFLCVLLSLCHSCRNYTAHVTKSIHRFHLSAINRDLFIFSFVPTSYFHDLFVFSGLMLSPNFAASFCVFSVRSLIPFQNFPTSPSKSLVFCQISLFRKWNDDTVLPSRWYSDCCSDIVASFFELINCCIPSIFDHFSFNPIIPSRLSILQALYDFSNFILCYGFCIDGKHLAFVKHARSFKLHRWFWAI